MPAKQIIYWQSKHPDACYSNLYGPTEITVDCTYYTLPRDWFGEVLPIGQACSNTDIIILDKNECAADSGELCVRGSSLALGYWNNQEKTSEVFCQNPLNNKFLDPIYRTGDIVTKKDGLIYYVGRKDFQIKHNGYRIELGDIESQIMQIDGIENCVCGYLTETKKIYAYLQTSNNLVTSNSVRRSLNKVLPKYMVPQKIEFIEEMLFTKNGKIDRKAFSDRAMQS